MLRSITNGLLAALALVLAHAGALAATCTADDFAAAVDKSGAQLRAFNAEALPKLQDKLKQLKEKKGWDEDKALDSVRDDRTAKLDAEAEDLIVKIDTLGRPPEKAAPDCSKLAELEAAGIELLAVMKAKSTYTLAKLDTQIAGEKEVAAASKDPAPAAKEAKPPAPADAPPPKPVAKSEAQKWATHTKQPPDASPRDDVPTLEPGSSVAMPPRSVGDPRWDPSSTTRRQRSG